MLQAFPVGTPFHGEFSSADAHSPAGEVNARFTLFGARQTSPALPTGLTLTATSVVIVTDILCSVGSSALVVNIFDGAAASPGAGNKIATINAAINGGAAWARQCGHYCLEGSYPKLLTNIAGQVDCIISGYIWDDPGT